MTFHVKGFLAFAAFAVVLTVSAEPRLGLVALAAWAVVETLVWAGAAGFGRPARRPQGDRVEH
jgi:hypothetical protein